MSNDIAASYRYTSMRHGAAPSRLTPTHHVCRIAPLRINAMTLRGEAGE